MTKVFVTKEQLQLLKEAYEAGFYEYQDDLFYKETDFDTMEPKPDALVTSCWEKHVEECYRLLP